MAKEIGERVHRKADGSWNWHGREVFLVDGTTFSMPDTQENQLAYPKSNPNNAIGFPIMRAVALVSLATGAVLDMAFAKYAGKGTGEIGLFRKVSQSLPVGSIVVADRYYPTYSTLAGLKARGIDVVSISHANARSRLYRWPSSRPQGSYRRMDQGAGSRPDKRRSDRRLCRVARDGFGSRIRDRHRRPRRRQESKPSSSRR